MRLFIQTLRTVDVTELFEVAGVPVNKPIKFEFNDSTYEFNPSPKANWLYYAFLAFVQLAKEVSRPELVVTVGTGSGLDGVALYETMRPQALKMIDVNPKVVSQGRYNLGAYFKRVDASLNWQVVLGNLCGSLEAGSADLIYANVPSIPGDPSLIFSGMNSSSFFDPAWAESSPEKLTRNYLALQYEFLHQARIALKPGGSAVIALGVRMAADMVEELFHTAGFDGFEAVVLDLKEQSQPEAVVAAYAKQEVERGVEFDFYRQGASTLEFPVEHSLKDFKQSLAEWRISAAEALELSKSGHKVYHVVAILRGKKK